MGFLGGQDLCGGGLKFKWIKLDGYIRVLTSIRALREVQRFLLVLECELCTGVRLEF